jgi:hypothetical protein
MRVVNNVEREMMKAEWENWLLDENLRCKQLQMIVEENRRNSLPNKRIKKADSQKVLDAKEIEESARMDTLRKWQEDYCGSCKLEQERLLDGRSDLAFV